MTGSFDMILDETYSILVTRYTCFNRQCY